MAGWEAGRGGVWWERGGLAWQGERQGERQDEVGAWRERGGGVAGREAGRGGGVAGVRWVGAAGREAGRGGAWRERGRGVVGREAGGGGSEVGAWRGRVKQGSD